MVAEAVEGALAQLAGGVTAEGAVQGVELGEQRGVLGEVAAAEGVGGRAPPAMIAQVAGAGVLRDEAGELGAGEAAELEQVLAHESFLGAAQAEVAQASQRVLDPGVELLAGGHGEVERDGSLEEGADLLEALKALGMQFHDHPPMIPKPRLQAHVPLESRHTLQAHVPLDKAISGTEICTILP